jgi:DNA replication protein DnaC
MYHDDFAKRDPRYLTLELPRRFADATVPGIAHPTVREVAADYCRQFDRVAPAGVAPLFAGPVQTYKTYAAAAVTRYAHFYAQVPVRFVSVPAAFARLERRRFDPETERDLADMKRVTFLVLDDFPLVGAGSYASAMLVEVVTHRFDAQLPTLLTGNVAVAKDDTSELDARFGPQFGRRVYDMSAGFRVSTHG